MDAASASASRASASASAVAHAYRVRIGHSGALELTAPMIVGRGPSAPRVARGARPQLVTVPSPTSLVSRSHVEIRQEGTVVVVTDLRSSNGTIVRQPGRVPTTLRQGESIVVPVGAIVDVGDGNVLEILPSQRTIPQEEPRQ